MFAGAEEQFIVSENLGELANADQILRVKQIEALKSLTNLLVREVESLEQQQARSPSGHLKEKIILYEEVQRFEANLIRSAMILTGGVQRRAAKMLGVKITTLNVKIRRYKIDVMNS